MQLSSWKGEINMIIVEKDVPFCEVEKMFIESNANTGETALANNTNKFALRNIRKADSTFSSWSCVKLSSEEVFDVMLPWHIGEGSEMTLVPRTGCTVRQAVKKLSQENLYHQECSECWGKLEHARKMLNSTIFLSERPVEGEDYEDLPTNSGLTHLDGLHRLVAWCYFDMIPQDGYVNAYIAHDAQYGSEK